jgi:uncharacterized membrane protein (DUF4010 family)
LIAEAFRELGLALLLGLLVGMQREKADSRIAGFRTFPLITILGALCGLLSPLLGGWIVGAGLIGVIAAAVIGNVHKMHAGQAEPGLTTEIAMMVMFGVGAYLTVGPPVVGIAVGGAVALLLHLKPELHGLAERLEDEDVRAIMQFVLIAFIVLPVLPNQAFGPFQVINPYDIWRMVVLIVGISLGGYIIYKFWGQQAGTVFGGILGGIISSTATTVSYARRTKEAPDSATMAALVVMIASTIVYIRVLIEIQVVGPSFLPAAAPRIGAMLAVSIILCGLWWTRVRKQTTEVPEQENPTELRPAIVFGVLYALVLLAVAIARDQFGNRGLFIVAGISGLTDMDAITLSTARLVDAGKLDGNQGWRMVIIAAMSNLVFKGGIVALTGHPRLMREIAILFGISLAAGAGVLLLA